MPKRVKALTKMVAYRRNQRVYIYEGVDPKTGRVFYIGRSLDIFKRGAQHDSASSGCKLLRLYLKLNDLKFRDCVRVVPELPNGVPASRAAELEAYFIIQRKTLYDPEDRPHGCNQQHGDHVAALDYQAVKEEVEAGFKEDEEVPADVIKARAEEAMLEACVEEVGDVEPELSMALSIATMTRKQLERRLMSPVAIAETLADEYEAMGMYKEIDRVGFEADVNSLRDRLKAENVQDDKMLSLVRSIALFGKSEGAEWSMRAHVAGHAFRMLAGALETREEARMPDTTAIRNMKLVRNWTVENDGKKPSNTALRRKDGTGTTEEATMGKFLSQWKSFKGNGAYKQANRQQSDFLMRHVPWWIDHANGSKAEKSANLTAKVNAMLKDGYGHKDEPEFGGKKQWPGGSGGNETRRVYIKMTQMVGGQHTKAGMDAILNGVNPARVNWYKEKAASNRPTYLAKKKERGANAQARSYANGAKPRKKRKLVETAVEDSGEESGEESGDDSDEESDEES